MKRLLLVVALVCLSTSLYAQRRAVEQVVEGMSIYDVAIDHEDDMLYVEMRLYLAEHHLKGHYAIIYTPILYHKGHSVELTPVGVYGRQHYYVDARQKHSIDVVPEEWRLRHRDLPAEVSYYAAIPYQSWMNGSTLRVEAVLYGCGDRIELLGEVIVGEYHEYVFNPVYVDVKPTMTMQGEQTSAYIDFRLMHSDIDPSYMDNASELDAMSKFFTSFACDKMCGCSALHITGYASPDGEYSVNAELAEARAEALRDHILSIVSLPTTIITIDSVAEDWDGVAQWVEASSLKNKSEILAIVRGTLAPDEKDAAIMSHFPEEYKVMLEECYPALRRAECTMHYRVNHESLSAESKSINAANEAMRKGDMSVARTYLQSAGSSPLADYARALYAIHMGEVKQGVALLQRAKTSVPEAAQLLKAMGY